MPMLSLDAHGEDGGRGGWGLQMALEAQQGVQRAPHIPSVQHQKPKPDPWDCLGKKKRGSVRAGVVNPWAPPLLALC